MSHELTRNQQCKPALLLAQLAGGGGRRTARARAQGRRRRLALAIRHQLPLPLALRESQRARERHVHWGDEPMDPGAASVAVSDVPGLAHSTLHLWTFSSARGLT